MTVANRQTKVCSKNTSLPLFNDRKVQSLKSYKRGDLQYVLYEAQLYFILHRRSQAPIDAESH